MEAKEVEARIKGELENFAKDTIEYFQKTGLNRPPNLPIYSKRINEISFKAGIREVIKWGDEPCIEHSRVEWPAKLGGGVENRQKMKRRRCQHCWQAKLKEVGS